jgi:hypothetical protein
VKKLKLWCMVGLVATGVALSGCGSSDSSSSVSLRVLNATNSHPSIDLQVNAAVVEPGTATDAVSAYAGPASGSNTLQITDAGVTTALATTVPTLSGGNHYTVVAYEVGSTVKTAIVSEDNTTPTSGTAQMRLYNTVVNAGKLDAYVANVADCTSTTLSTLSPLTTFTSTTTVTATTLATYSPGTYRVCVTKNGDSSDLRMELTVTLVSQQIAFVVMTPTTGGSLINGSVLTQQGSNVATRNTNARVRLAAAVSGSPTVSANATLSGATTTTIDVGSTAPAFGYYVLVPNAASRALNITVSSLGSVAAPSTALAAGGDYTLLVYGTSTSATASLLTDDNRPPTDGSSVKLRLIHGVTGNVGGLTLTANSSLVASGLAAGTASGYVAVTANTSTSAATLKLTSSVAGTLLTDVNDPLSADTVYTILAGGDVGAAQLIIR